MILIARAVVTHQTKQNGACHVWASVAGLRPKDPYRRRSCQESGTQALCTQALPILQSSGFRAASRRATDPAKRNSS